MTVDIICADVRDGLARFPDGHFHCCVTSPPYWGLRDYGLEPTVWGGDGCEHEWVDDSVKVERGAGNWTHGKPQTRFRGDLVAARANTEYATATRGHCRRCNAWRGTLGLEPTPELYVEHLVSVLREVRRVLRPDGTCWLNIGDSYGSGTRATRDYSHNTKHGYWQNPAIDKRIPAPAKQLLGMPWRVAFALQADGWWLRSDIVWSKPNPMPESVRDRPTRAHEMLFLLTKRERYYYDQDAIREPLAPASIERISQPSFDEQTGGPKDYRTTGVNRHRSARQGLEGLAKRYRSGNKERKLKVPTRPNDHRGSSVPWEDNGTGRNRRSVWEIATQPFGLEMCASCRTIYTPAQYWRLRGGSNPRCNHEVVEDEPCGGTNWLAHDGGAMCAACETFYTAKQLTSLPRAAKCRRCQSEEWLSHFAVFPEKLVEPCILTTSEWGCCPECGAPWERVVESDYVQPTTRPGNPAIDRTRYEGRHEEGVGYRPDQVLSRESRTTGWRPTCKHGAEPVPCRILDPFAGSGTVGVVAERLGRHSVLIDAKEEYCEMARHRTAQRGLMV